MSVMTIQLSAYFTLEEFTHSETAARKGIDNTPTPAMVAKLQSLAWKMDEVRKLLGVAINVSSAYRSPELNAAVGSKPTSSHLLGEAVDFTCYSYGNNQQVFQRIKDSSLAFDQLILEYPDHSNGGWVHIGFGLKGRRECLKITAKGTEVVK